MLPGNTNLPDGLGLRPARPSDHPFIQSLYSATRDDLRLIDGERDFVESIVSMQFRAQTASYGDQYPNAMYFVVEKLGERIGRVTIDFGSNEVHVLDVAFISEVRGKGYGTALIQAIQYTAAKLKAPVALSVLKSNFRARNLYLSLGFKIEENTATHERLIWYPDIIAMQGA